jgi:REase_DpnII-MboI
MAEYLVETINHLRAFFSAKYQEYLEDMKELRPQNGYGDFNQCNEVRQALCNIVLNIHDTFGDLRIPEGFSSPLRLVSTLENYQQLLKGHNDLLEDVFKHYQGEREPPYIALQISRINNEVLDAVSFALSFEEAKQYSLGTTSLPMGESEAIRRVKTILDRFHTVAHQLTQRRSDNKQPRPTLRISDEYDVQDLLHALLKIDFDDIRNEDPVPSHAGAASRTDFSLRKYGIVIEVKMTRKGLADGEIGKQLLVDIERYQKYPDCKYLIAFIYDPGRHVKNPAGLTGDLTGKTGKITVEVMLRPQ